MALQACNKHQNQPSPPQAPHPQIRSQSFLHPVAQQGNRRATHFIVLSSPSNPSMKSTTTHRRKIKFRLFPANSTQTSPITTYVSKINAHSITAPTRPSSFMHSCVHLTATVCVEPPSKVPTP
ncbi:hypothetical protein HDV57DRAFT_493649 [Trichoderma longibrachiatum]